jgi:hypothetical protein
MVMKTYKEFINEAQVRFSKNLYKDKVGFEWFKRCHLIVHDRFLFPYIYFGY